MPPEKYLAAITGENGTSPVGAGFLVTDRHVLTCAHVVNVASGAPPTSSARPVQSVSVTFLAADASAKLRASVKSDNHWRPPLPHNATAASDMAILTLDNPAPAGTAKASMRERNSLKGWAYDLLGFPDGWDNGQGQSGFIGEPLVGRYELLEAADNRPFVRKGFSGSPVRCESRTSKGIIGVVGMVVAARKGEQEKTAYMIPTQELRAFLSQLDGVDMCNGVLDDFPHIKLLQNYLDMKVVVLRDNTEFDLRIKRVDSMDAIAELFREDPRQNYDNEAKNPEDILQAPEPAMLLVQSPGGAGKSNFLAASIQDAIGKGIVPFFLDATAGSKTPSDATSWDLAFLLGTFTVAGGIDVFRKAESEVGLQRIVLFADRLNENPSQAGAILDAIRKAVKSEVPGIRLVVADRLKDRLGNIAPLVRATILPLSINEMHMHLKYPPPGRSAKLLAMPFFLDMQLRADKTDKGSPLTRSEVFRKFFLIHAGVTDDSLPRLAASGFKAYQESKSTVMSAPSWTKTMGEFGISEPLQQRIIGGAMLQYTPENTTEEVVEFRHQLLHDFLAGHHLAAMDEELWRERNFDIATLETQSFEAIEFAAEQLDLKATGLLIQVYDWNWVGVLETVRNLDAGRHGGKSPLSPEFQDSLYFLNAVRLFDCFENSRRKTKQIMAGVRTSSGLYLDSVKSFPDLRQMVSTSFTPTEEYFKQWKKLFLHDAQDSVSTDDLPVLWTDPFMSWTAASVYRKMHFDDKVPAFLQMTYGLVLKTGADRPEAIGLRWRIVHLLGVVDKRENSDFLWSVVTDSHEGSKWVRQGAVRSYIENAALTESAAVRQSMIAKLADWVRGPSRIPTVVMKQMRTCARLSNGCPRDDWDKDYVAVLESGITRAKTEGDSDEQQAWQQIKDEILATVDNAKDGEVSGGQLG